MTGGGEVIKLALTVFAYITHVLKIQLNYEDHDNIYRFCVQ